MAEVSWMKEGPFGVMVHWNVQTLPRAGTPPSDWNKRVDAFPVEPFVDTLASTGAKWLIFTCGWWGDAFCAPNASIECYFPGHCSRRDLIAELGAALHRRGMRLIVYFQTEVDHESEAMRVAFGWDLDPKDKSVFQQRWTEVVRTYAEQWETLIDGWWFDGCCDSMVMTFLRTYGAGWDNRRFDVAEWFSAARAGNPQAIVAMDSGVAEERHVFVFPEEDYLAGESNDLLIRPTNGPLQDGKQWHGLVWIDCRWCHCAAINSWAKEKIEIPRFTDGELLDYLNECRRHRGGVTFNIGIYEDGSLAEATVAQLARIHKEYR